MKPLTKRSLISNGNGSVLPQSDVNEKKRPRQPSCCLAVQITECCRMFTDTESGVVSRRPTSWIDHCSSVGILPRNK